MNKTLTETQINWRWVEILVKTLSLEKSTTIGPGDAVCFVSALRALLAAQQPESRAEVTGWQPIETAQEGQLVVVGWLDPTDPEHPERHDFDWLEEGVWQRHFADYEHFITCAPAGSTGPSEEAPYTHWIPIGEIPRAARAGEGQ